jgi:hypothetical protein
MPIQVQAPPQTNNQTQSKPTFAIKQLAGSVDEPACCTIYSTNEFDRGTHLFHQRLSEE